MGIERLWKIEQDTYWGKETRNLEKIGGKGTFPCIFLNPFSFLSVNLLHILSTQIIYTI